ncbi:MAG: hypothetical protein WAM66_13860 [Acidobacteriaceae bacterium]
MAGIEFPAELHKKIEETGPVDLMVGVTGPAGEELCATSACLQGMAAKTVVAYAGVGQAEPVRCSSDVVQLAAYPMRATANSFALWADVAEAQRNVLALAVAWHARACLVIHNDLAALNPEAARLLAEPVLGGQSDLVMPLYPHGKYDGLITKSLLAPMSRALFGMRVQFPLSFDFCAGSHVLAKIAESGPGRSDGPRLLWATNAVAVQNGQIGQASVNVQHPIQTGDLDLSAILSELVGSLFEEVETYAAQWQRVRGSQPVARYGDAAVLKHDAQPVDPRPMVESFVLGSRNLEEVWRLVLPPATMLDLRRMARMDPESFRMPDALWARIVYDFALAHRMRRVSRSHVLGALTPLYLGWVASYTQEVGGATAEEADRRIEKLARTFEEQKPYLVSRWRWPERVS